MALNYFTMKRFLIPRRNISLIARIKVLREVVISRVRRAALADGRDCGRKCWRKFGYGVTTSRSGRRSSAGVTV